MRHRPQSLLAAGALVVLGAGSALETARHGHATWELDLRPHELARVTHAGAGAGGRHWDAATADHHPSCPACLGAATPSDRPALATPGIAQAPRDVGYPRIPPPPAIAKPASPASGRAPPTPASSS